MITYKVWIEVERHDTETDERTHDPRLEFTKTGQFANGAEARDFALQLHEYGLKLSEESA